MNKFVRHAGEACLVFTFALLFSEGLMAKDPDGWPANDKKTEAAANKQTENPPTAQGRQSLSFGELRGFIRNAVGAPLPGAQVIARYVEENADRIAVSGGDGSFLIDNLRPGHYRLAAHKEGFASSSVIPVELRVRKSLSVDLILGASVSASRGSGQDSFFKKFFRAYADDWKGNAQTGPTPDKRGYPPPLTTPPYPFADWPYGGSVDIGSPWTQSSPLMQAIWSGPHGDAWKRSGIQL